MTDPLMLLLPEAALAAGVIGVLTADLVLPAGRKAIASWIGVAACMLAAVAAAAATQGTVASMLSIDGLVVLARPAILLSVLLVLLAGREEHGHEDDHGAWVATVVGLGCGALITAAAANLVTLWLGLELMSLAGYALAAWRGGDRLAAEAGMKYVLFGGVATGLSLFGMSHVYGLTGHLDFAGITVALADGLPLPAVAALCLAGVGLAYKLAIVPFHFYAPDVYQGAPAIGIAALAVIPKFAVVAVLVRGLEMIPTALVPWTTLGAVLAGLAVASLLVAAFTALAQRDAKRIVAFSAIGHAGAVLLAVGCQPGRSAIAAAAIYLVAYAVANIGALVCLAVIERERGSCALEAMPGLMRQRPWLTAALCLFLFSLVGVPPLAGFLAKWGLLGETLRVGLGEAGRGYMVWAALALLASTAISAWAYLLIVRAAVLAPAPETQKSMPRLGAGTFMVLTACAVMTIVLGLWLDGFAVIANYLAR